MLKKRTSVALSSVQVSGIERLTPNMQRLVFEGDVLADFPADIAGGYVKFGFYPDGKPFNPGSGVNVHDTILRTYSVRHLQPEANCLTVDFVLHGNGKVEDGPASAFARHARVGDRIGITGPGRVKSLDPAAEAFVIAGDMTALPALTAKLEQLRTHHTIVPGLLIVELLDKEDVNYLEPPEGLQLHTVINPDPTQSSEGFIRKIRELNWPPGNVFAWCAAEFKHMQSFRALVRDEHHIGLNNRYVSSYWMAGRNEQGHKAKKRRDARSQRWAGWVRRRS